MRSDQQLNRYRILERIRSHMDVFIVTNSIQMMKNALFILTAHILGNYIIQHLKILNLRLLELNTNSIFAGRSAYRLIGTYELHSFGLQKLMEVGTIIGDKAYSVQYIADAPRYTDYLPTVQKMIDSMVIKPWTN